MGFKLAAGKDWFSEYGWLSIPKVELDHTVAQPSVKKTNMKKSTLKKDKAVKFDN